MSHQFPRIFAPFYISVAKHHSIANWTDHNAAARLRQDLRIMLLKLILRKDDTKPGFHWIQKSSLIVFNELYLAQSSVFSLLHSLFSPRDERSCVINLTATG